MSPNKPFPDCLLSLAHFITATGRVISTKGIIKRDLKQNNSNILHVRNEEGLSVQVEEQMRRLRVGTEDALSYLGTGDEKKPGEQGCLTFWHFLVENPHAIQNR